MGFIDWRGFFKWKARGPLWPRVEELEDSRVERGQPDGLTRYRADKKKEREEARALMQMHGTVDHYIAAKLAEAWRRWPPEENHTERDRLNAALYALDEKKACQHEWREATRILEEEAAEAHDLRRRRVRHVIAVRVMQAWLVLAVLFVLGVFLFAGPHEVRTPLDAEVDVVVAECRPLWRDEDRVRVEVEPWPFRTVTVGRELVVVKPPSPALAACISRAVERYAPWRFERSLLDFDVKRPRAPAPSP